MRFKTICFTISLALLMCTGANATLTTIGTAEYDGRECNLIWDDDNNGESIVWMGCTQLANTWENLMEWADSLGSQLSVTIYPGYTTNIDWTTGWRLPRTVDGPYVYGYDGSTTGGYNITTSELGHLFYEELGNLGSTDTSGNFQPNAGLDNRGDFDGLVENYYWSVTVYATKPYNAWVFSMQTGFQIPTITPSPCFAVAVRSGEVFSVQTSAGDLDDDFDVDGLDLALFIEDSSEVLLEDLASSFGISPQG